MSRSHSNPGPGIFFAPSLPSHSSMTTELPKRISNSARNHVAKGIRRSNLEVNETEEGTPRRPATVKERRPSTLTIAPIDDDTLDTDLKNALRELNAIKARFDISGASDLKDPDLLGAVRLGTHKGTKLPDVNASKMGSLAAAAATRSSNSRPVSSRSGAAIGEKTAEEKLVVAEEVMKRLYQRNQQLEKALTSAGHTMSMKPSAMASAFADPSGHQHPANWFDAGLLERPRDTVSTAMRKDLLRTPVESSSPKVSARLVDKLKQEMKDLHEKHRVELAAKDEEILKLQVKSQKELNKAACDIETYRVQVSKVKSALLVATNDATFQKANYERAQGDFTSLAMNRLRDSTSAAAVSRHVKESIAAMAARVQGMEQAFKELALLYDNKLYATEKQACDSYVERRRGEERVKQLQRDIEERDELSKTIDKHVQALRAKLKDVTEENERLKPKTAT